VFFTTVKSFYDPKRRKSWIDSSQPSIVKYSKKVLVRKGKSTEL